MFKKVTLIIVFIIIPIVINLQFLFRILLNKKYVVREISSTNDVDGLNSMQKIIELDYTSIMWLIIMNIIFIIGLVVCFLVKGGSNGSQSQTKR